VLLAKKKDIDLVFNMLPKPPIILADEKRLSQVLGNLITNAIKFTDKGSVTINVKLFNNKVQVDVIDTGTGIKKEDIPKLFTKFFQVQEAATRKTKGTGLGLAISKSIIEAHKGRIWASSKGLGKGSTFSFSLPVKKK